jgi:hypothetical protein
MKTKRSLWRSALLASAAFGPLLVSHESMAQGAPGAGSFPGSFLIPGTQTSFKIGGYVKLDYTYDFGAQQTNGSGTGVPALIQPFGPLDSGVLHIGGVTIPVQADPGHHIHGDSQFTAAESRFNIETRTPTPYGELKTFIEGDFSNPNGLSNSAAFKEFTNSNGFRLRQAYGALGPFLAGQTFDLFRDAQSEGETLDFGGDSTTGRTRVPQVRYTLDFGNGLTWAMDAQEPQTNVIDANAAAPGACLPGGIGACFASPSNGNLTTFGKRQGDKIPDFATAIQYSAPWGHVRASGVLRDIYWHQGIDGSNDNLSTFGWAVSFTGTFNVPIGKDTVGWEVGYGDGGGAFLAVDESSAPDAVWTGGAHRTLRTIKSGLAAVNYTHYWTDTLRTNVTGSYFQQQNRASDFGGNSTEVFNFLNEQKSAYTVHVNLIWSPVPQTNFGVEFIRVQGKLQDGQTSQGSRLQASAQFKF